MNAPVEGSAQALEPSSPGKLRRAWSRLPTGLREALKIYACFRLPVELMLTLGMGTMPFAHGALAMPPLDGPSWLQAWLRWDAGWYVRIIREGFSYVDCTAPQVACAQASIAFLPAFPMAARALTWVGFSVTVATFVVTHLALLFALWGLWELSRKWLDESGSRRALVAMLSFPTAIFLSAAYAEGLFLACGIWAMVFFERNRALPAALCVTVGALTRSQGMLLVAALCLGALFHRRFKLAFLAGGVAAAALGAYLYWQHHTFGDALAFVHARRGWNFIGQPAWEQIHHYWMRTKAGQLALEGWFDFASIFWLLVSGIFAFRKLSVAYGLFVLAILGTAMVPGQVWALGRIALVAFPGFVLLGAWTKNRTLARVLFIAGLTWVVMGGLRYVHGFFTGT